MERFFEDWPGWRRPTWRLEEEMMPPVEVGETDDEVFVNAQVPGMKKENLEVEFTEGSLTIKCESKEEEEKKGKNYYRREFSYGLFSRTVPIPPAADASKATAELRDGVLKVHIPKTEEAKKHTSKIEIR